MPVLNVCMVNYNALAVEMGGIVKRSAFSYPGPEADSRMLTCLVIQSGSRAIALELLQKPAQQFISVYLFHMLHICKDNQLFPAARESDV